MTTEITGQPKAGRWCTHCGRPVASDLRYCGHCGRELAGKIARTGQTPFETLGFKMGTALMRGGTKRWLGVLLFVVIFLVLIVAYGGSSSNPQYGTVSPTKSRDQADSKVVDPHREIQAVARKNYIDTIREEIRNAGADASVSDVGDELSVVSDAFKLKPDRDQFIRQAFGPKTRKDLCVMGFKSFAVKSGIIFGDGDEYSLGCAETGEERKARSEEERAERDQLISDLQQAFQNDPQSPGAKVTQQNNELVLTVPSAKNLAPAKIRQMWGAQFSGSAKSGFCKVGLRGLRVKSSLNDVGTLISFGCAANKVTGVSNADSTRSGTDGTTPATPEGVSVPVGTDAKSKGCIDSQTLTPIECK